MPPLPGLLPHVLMANLPTTTSTRIANSSPLCLPTRPASLSPAWHPTSSISSRWRRALRWAAPSRLIHTHSTHLQPLQRVWPALSSTQTRPLLCWWPGLHLCIPMGHWRATHWNEGLLMAVRRFPQWPAWCLTRLLLIWTVQCLSVPGALMNIGSLPQPGKEAQTAVSGKRSQLDLHVQQAYSHPKCWCSAHSLSR